MMRLTVAIGRKWRTESISSPRWGYCGASSMCHGAPFSMNASRALLKYTSWLSDSIAWYAPYTVAAEISAGLPSAGMSRV